MTFLPSSVAICGLIFVVNGHSLNEYESFLR